MKTILFLLLAPLGALATEGIQYLEALEAIVDRHPDVAAQAAQVDVVRGRTLPTRLALLPSLSLYARQDARKEFGLNESRVGAGASVDFNLFRFGSDWAGMKAANREIEAEINTLANTKIRVESLGVDALNQWMLSAQEAEILSRVLVWREHLLQIGKQRFARGVIPQQEVDKISIDWENDRALLRDAETAIVRAVAQLEQLLGHHNVQADWPWKEQLVKKNIPALDNGETLLKERPDWVAAQTRLAAAQARTSQSWGRIFPSLDLNFTYGYFSAQASGVSLDRAEYASSLILSVPLFDRLANYGAYEAQVNTAKQAEMDLERVRRLAKNEWDSASGALALATETAVARDKTLRVARGLYEDNVRRYERGLVEANGLSVDQQRLLQSEQLAIRGWAGAHSTLARLCFARGLRIKECL